jgi:hypothetical protein
MKNIILSILLCASLTACISVPYYQPVYGYPRVYAPQYPTHWEQRANYSPAQQFSCNTVLIRGVIKYNTPYGYVVVANNGQLFDKCVPY